MHEISPAALVELALNLTNSVVDEDRFDRLLNTVRHTIACDAVALLRIQGAPQNALLEPLAQQGLTPDILGRQFDIASHPRFAEICQSPTPVRFPANCTMPDPYEGMWLSHEGNLPGRACMGLPLLADGVLIGVLTLDSMTPKAFDDIPRWTLNIITAMSSATLKTAITLQQLESHYAQRQQIVKALTQEALRKDGGELIGSSTRVLKLKHEISMVAKSDFPVLIEGETGVGKELVARTLHNESERAEKALVYVNCAALPKDLIESELFGHVKGAFIGADRDHEGKFKLANGGTLFIDEVAELPLSAQDKLLNVLQNNRIQVIGGEIESVDVRVLTATNRSLTLEMESGRFRSDLYHKLNVYPLQVPPLRDREEDIGLLSTYFAEQIRRKLGLQQLSFSPSALSKLNAYNWPGNVRELEHILTRSALRAKSISDSPNIKISAAHIENLVGETSTQHDVKHLRQNTQTVVNLRAATQDFQRQLINDILEEENGNWTSSARRLETDRANLSRLARRLGVDVKKHIIKDRLPINDQATMSAHPFSKPI